MKIKFPKLVWNKLLKVSGNKTTKDGEYATEGSDEDSSAQKCIVKKMDFVPKNRRTKVNTKGAVEKNKITITSKNSGSHKKKNKQTVKTDIDTKRRFFDDYSSVDYSFDDYSSLDDSILESAESQTTATKETEIYHNSMIGKLGSAFTGCTKFTDENVPDKLTTNHCVQCRQIILKNERDEAMCFDQGDVDVRFHAKCYEDWREGKESVPMRMNDDSASKHDHNVTNHETESIIRSLAGDTCSMITEERALDLKKHKNKPPPKNMAFKACTSYAVDNLTDEELASFSNYKCAECKKDIRWDDLFETLDQDNGNVDQRYHFKCYHKEKEQADKPNETVSKSQRHDRANKKISKDVLRKNYNQVIMQDVEDAIYACTRCAEKTLSDEDNVLLFSQYACAQCRGRIRWSELLQTVDGKNEVKLHFNCYKDWRKVQKDLKKKRMQKPTTALDKMQKWHQLTQKK